MTGRDTVGGELKELALVAARACDTPAAFIALAQECRAHVGWDVAKLDVATFCEQVLRSDNVLVVPDVASDARFAGRAHARFFAGAPLLGRSGVVGVIAVLDEVPRVIDAAQLDTLRILSRLVVAQLELQQRHDSAALLASSLIDSALDAVIAMDAAGNVVEVNPAAERMFGFTRDAALGKDLTLLIVPPDQRENHHRGLQRHLATGQRRNLGRRVEVTGMRADGSTFPLELSVNRIDTDPPMFAGFLRDLTEQRQLETHVRRAQKLDAVGQLASGIAHDFNNILMVIEHNAELLATAQLEHEAASAVAEISRSTARASALTRQLMMLSRKRPIQRERLALPDIVDDLSRAVLRLVGEHIELSTTHDAAPAPTIEADVGMLEQVILNLAVNARDAMPRGGRLALRTGARTLARPLSLGSGELPAAHYATLEVSDTGEGIAPDIVTKIFEPFFTTKAVGKGTGLGLSTVAGIVREHGGGIEVETRVGTGSTFRIYFPTVDAPRAHAARPASEPSPGGRETLLLVEDEAVVRTSIATMLRRKGYTVLEAGNAAQALERWYAHADAIALVVTDVVMPGQLSGIELASRLHADRPALPIIFTSGYAEAHLRDDERLVEGSNFLPKPYSPDALARLVRTHLDKR